MMKRVALVLDLNKDFNRKVAAGVAKYAHATHWSVYLADEPARRVPRLQYWDGDGIIANLASEGLARLLVRLKKPLVAVGGGFGGGRGGGLGGRALLHEAPYVATDDVRVGRMAARHLLERGFRHLAYCGYRKAKTYDWSALRGEGFAAEARTHEASVDIFRPRTGDVRRWSSFIGETSAWVHGLPKPVGILAADDMRAYHLLEAVREAGYETPKEVGVMGVDNDVLACSLSEPSLTSIGLNGEGIGYEAGRILNLVLKGKKAPRETHIAPLRLVQRDSTNIRFDRDPLVEKALWIVHEKLGQGLQAGELAEACGVSMVTLNKRFRASRGLTAFEWMRRERLRLIRLMVEETELPLREVARRAGLGSAAYLCHVYRGAFGRSPRQH